MPQLEKDLPSSLPNPSRWQYSKCHSEVRSDWVRICCGTPPNSQAHLWGQHCRPPLSVLRHAGSDTIRQSRGGGNGATAFRCIGRIKHPAAEASGGRATWWDMSSASRTTPSGTPPGLLSPSSGARLAAVTTSAPGSSRHLRMTSGEVYSMCENKQMNSSSIFRSFLARALFVHLP